MSHGLKSGACLELDYTLILAQPPIHRGAVGVSFSSMGGSFLIYKMRVLVCVSGFVPFLPSGTCDTISQHSCNNNNQRSTPCGVDLPLSESSPELTLHCISCNNHSNLERNSRLSSPFYR